MGNWMGGRNARPMFQVPNEFAKFMHVANAMAWLTISEKWVEHGIKLIFSSTDLTLSDTTDPVQEQLHGTPCNLSSGFVLLMLFFYHLYLKLNRRNCLICQSSRECFCYILWLVCIPNIANTISTQFQIVWPLIAGIEWNKFDLSCKNDFSRIFNYRKFTV